MDQIRADGLPAVLTALAVLQRELRLAVAVVGFLQTAEAYCENATQNCGETT